MPLVILNKAGMRAFGSCLNSLSLALITSFIVLNRFAAHVCTSDKPKTSDALPSRLASIWLCLARHCARYRRISAAHYARFCD